jgi:hypothetical protein
MPEVRRAGGGAVLLATERQVAANRRNAARSTGPKTVEGKRAASANAIKHGLLADTAFVPGLDRPDEWRSFRDAYLEDLEPEGVLEQVLAERVVATSWRLARLGRYERDAIKDAPNGAGQFFIDDDEMQTQTRMQLPGVDLLTTITRYEGHLHRQFMQCLHELQRVQARRKGTPGDAPPTVDVILSSADDLK